MAFNPLNPEWPKQTTDLIDRFVQGIRSKFTSKAVTATNAIVFGLVAMFAMLVASVVGLILGIRAVQSYVTWDLGTAAMWVVGSIAVAGLLLVVIGLISSAKAAMAMGGFVAVVAGARWALDAGKTGIDHDTSVWISYLVVGGLFMLLGALVMAKRHTPVES